MIELEEGYGDFRIPGKGKCILKTNAPKHVTWLLSVILGVLGILGQIVPVAALTPYSFWLVAIAFIVLALATVLEGL